MDLFDELENLAVGATYEEPKENAAFYDPTEGTIKIWQERFGYTFDQAMAIIRITQTVKKPSTAAQQAIISATKARIIYALKLRGPFSTPQKAQIAANLSKIPESYHCSGEEGAAVFCKVDGQANMAIENWFSTGKDQLQTSICPRRKSI